MLLENLILSTIGVFLCCPYKTGHNKTGKVVFYKEFLLYFQGL